MSHAVAWGLITANPVRAVKRPAIERPKLEVPTPKQLRALIEAAEGTIWAVPIGVAAATGARRGEVLALTWANVDLDGARVRIERSLQNAGHTLTFVDPKTDRARPEIALPRFAVERLRRHRAEQAARRLQLGDGWQDFDLVSGGDGRPLHPDSFSKAFRRIAKAAGLSPATRLHDIRHAVGTALLSEGVHPAITSAVLGHASAAFTMNCYQHVLDGMTTPAANALDAALGDAC
jgi:integrase